MLGIENVASFLMAAAMVIIVPGPATFLVAGHAQYSALRAGRAAAGILVGDGVLITFSGLGFAALVSKWPVLLAFIKVGGALYVVYLGIELLRNSPTPRESVLGPSGRPPSGAFLKGLLVTVTNPKPILFFGAFFPMFIDPGARSWMGSFYMLGGLFEVLNLAYFALVIALITRLRKAATLERFSAGFNKLGGYGLLLCGVSILATLV